MHRLYIIGALPYPYPMHLFEEYRPIQLVSLNRELQTDIVKAGGKISCLGPYDEFNAMSPSKRISGSFEHKPLRSLSSSLLFTPFFYIIGSPAAASQCMASVYK